VTRRETPRRRTRGCIVAFAGIVCSVALSCAADELPPSPIDQSPTGTGATSGYDPPGNPTPPRDACREIDPGSTDDGSGTDDGGFKFDVGADSDADGIQFTLTCDDVRNTQTNLGCEFWAVDLPNDSRGTDASPPAADQQFSIVVANASSLDPAHVAVYLGAEEVTPLESVEVPVNGTYVFELDPTSSIDPTGNSYDGVAFRIASDVPITAYQFNPLDNEIEVYSNDASLLFPAHAMAADYTAITGYAVMLAMSQDDPDAVNAGAFVTVVGIEDGTTFDVYPTAELYDGATESLRLDRGRVITLLSAGTDDGNLSGTRIAADRPIAVFAGNVATIEPFSSSTVCCADHMEHQMLPLESWGTAYAVAPPPAPTGGDNDPANYRVTASFDGTRFEYCQDAPPGAPGGLDAYETAEFESNQPFTIRSTDRDKPFAIVQLLESTRATGRNDLLGDPAMIALPAAAQFQRKYVFAVPSGYEADFVTLVTRGLGDVKLDGESIPASAFSELAVLRGVMHHYAHVGVEAGSHRVEATIPMAITVVGYDTAVSYGFTGGLGLNVIAPPPPAP
jgi:hypothetical protein